MLRAKGMNTPNSPLPKCCMHLTITCTLELSLCGGNVLLCYRTSSFKLKFRDQAGSLKSAVVEVYSPHKSAVTVGQGLMFC